MQNYINRMHRTLQSVIRNLCLEKVRWDHTHTIPPLFSDLLQDPTKFSSAWIHKEMGTRNIEKIGTLGSVSIFRIFI